MKAKPQNKRSLDVGDVGLRADGHWLALADRVLAPRLALAVEFSTAVLCAHFQCSARDLQLELIPRNPDRRDYPNKLVFRVISRRKTLCHLTVGQGLSDLWHRTRAFHKACPTIAVTPLFFRRTKQWECMGVEFFAGEALESWVNSGRLSEAEAVRHMRTVLDTLSATTRPSTTEAALQELHQLFDRVTQSAIFGGLDYPFLRNAVFPLIQRGILSQPLICRWSNGDFVPRNVLIDVMGGVRLIDYEFAHRTHFGAEDFWRWKTYTTLPVELRTLPGSYAGQFEGGWMEAYAILRQAILAEQTNLVHLASADVDQWMQRLLEIVTIGNDHFRSSRLIRPLAHAVLEIPCVRPAPEAKDGATRAQLFWSSTGVFDEAASHTLDLVHEQMVPLRFLIRGARGTLQLRLDPACGIGLIKIEGIRVLHPATSTILLSLTASTGWEVLQLSDGLYRLADSPELNLLSLNTDPNFLLPVVSCPEGYDTLVCEVWLQYRSDISTLPNYFKNSVLNAGGALLEAKTEEIQALRQIAANQGLKQERLRAEGAQREQQWQEQEAAMRGQASVREAQLEELKRQREQDRAEHDQQIAGLKMEQERLLHEKQMLTGRVEDLEQMLLTAHKDQSEGLALLQGVNGDYIRLIERLNAMRRSHSENLKAAKSVNDKVSEEYSSRINRLEMLIGDQQAKLSAAQDIEARQINEISELTQGLRAAQDELTVCRQLLTDNRKWLELPNSNYIARLIRNNFCAQVDNNKDDEQGI